VDLKSFDRASALETDAGENLTDMFNKGARFNMCGSRNFFFYNFHEYLFIT